MTTIIKEKGLKDRSKSTLLCMLHIFTTSELDRDECPASQSAHFNPGKEAPVEKWMDS
jgi:hypothetical protein